MVERSLRNVLKGRKRAYKGRLGKDRSPRHSRHSIESENGLTARSGSSRRCRAGHCFDERKFYFSGAPAATRASAKSL